MAIENCNKGSISIKRVKSTKIGLKETEESKACTCLIRKKLYEFGLIFTVIQSTLFRICHLFGWV